jgi:ATP-dependent exoDNAse (exonuclease V) beta subunit
VRAVVGIPAGLVETVAPAGAVTTDAMSADVMPADVMPAPVAPAPESETTGETPINPENVAITENSTKAESSANTAEVPANAATTDQRRKRLPRRHSPRHDSSTRDEGSAANDAASPASSDMPASAQPTPEEAGAWMGAFLNSNDDSAQEQ